MINGKQRRILMKELNLGASLQKASLKAGIDRKTAQKYREKPEPEASSIRYWRTRENPFHKDWEMVTPYLETNPALESKTIFEYLQRLYPGRYQDNQIRTLQRHIKEWRGLYGPEKIVMFPQEHPPGKLCASDYTCMNEIGVTISGQSFPHKLYHFVLTHSNWETGTVCYSESFASLSEGLQNALFELGAVPEEHLTDRLSAAVSNLSEKKEFTRDYSSLLSHYSLKGRKTQPRHPNENGDVEQSNYRFKKALSQSLMLRGSVDFQSLEDYKKYLQILFGQLNAGRSEALKREYENMKSLPTTKKDIRKTAKVKVSQSSTIRYSNNIYSVPSRLIGEVVDLLIGLEKIEVFYGRKLIESLPRMVGDNKSHINYRHIIDSLVRKPGAFENYKYQESMFPSTHFRIAYDELCHRKPAKATKEYLKILEVAAKDSEVLVEGALIEQINKGECPSLELIEHYIQIHTKPSATIEVEIGEVNLSEYDALIKDGGDSHD